LPRLFIHHSSEAAMRIAVFIDYWNFLKHLNEMLGAKHRIEHYHARVNLNDIGGILAKCAHAVITNGLPLSSQFPPDHDVPPPADVPAYTHIYPDVAIQLFLPPPEPVFTCQPSAAAASSASAPPPRQFRSSLFMPSQQNVLYVQSFIYCSYNPGSEQECKFKAWTDRSLAQCPGVTVKNLERIRTECPTCPNCRSRIEVCGNCGASLETPHEKGVDTLLVADLVEMGMCGNYDCVVIVSSDADMVPAAEFVKRLNLPVIHARFPSPIGDELDRHCTGSFNLMDIVQLFLLHKQSQPWTRMQEPEYPAREEPLPQGLPPSVQPPQQTSGSGKAAPPNK
jgi:hypothetical protein